MINIATGTWDNLDLVTNTTAFGYGHDGWWYGNLGSGGIENIEARTLTRMSFAGMGFVESIGVGARRIEDVATSPDGTMYGVGEGFLFSIDRATGVQTDIGSTGFFPLGVAVIDTHELVAADGEDLYVLDPDTGAATFVFPMDGSNDLAGMPAAPVPAMSRFGLAGLALALVIAMAWAIWTRLETKV